MGWINVIGAGVSLVGTASAASSARRSTNQATQIAQENRAAVNRVLPANGFNINAGGLGGPSFTYGGINGSDGWIVGGSQPNPSGASVGQAVQGSTTLPGTYRDPNTGTIFDGITGEAVNYGGTQVRGNQTHLNIDIPEFNFDAGPLHNINAQLGELGGEYSGIADEFGLVADEFGVLRDEFGNVGPQVSDRLLGISSQAGELLPRVATGSSEMRDVRRNAIGDARDSRLSDLRDSMARRRISGSSFADDTLSRTEADFGREMAASDAQATIEEISATAEILGFQARLINDSGNQLLAALNGQGLALSGRANALAGQTQALNGELSALGLQSDNEQFIASTALEAEQLSFAADATALSLAFQGQGLANNYITNLLAIANGATDMVASSLTNQASLSGGAANGFLALGGAFASNIGKNNNTTPGGSTVSGGSNAGGNGFNTAAPFTGFG